MANTTKAGRFRFPLYSFAELGAMSDEEWNEECRLCGADMRPHRDEDPPTRTEHPNEQNNT